MCADGTALIIGALINSVLISVDVSLTSRLSARFSHGKQVTVLYLHCDQLSFNTADHMVNGCCDLTFYSNL